jgi:hypothetical protein
LEFLGLNSNEHKSLEYNILENISQVDESQQVKVEKEKVQEIPEEVRPSDQIVKENSS